MVSYDIISDRELWNQEILSNTNFSPYQLYEWGLYKKQLGWGVIPLKGKSKGKVGYLQLTYKIKANVLVAWCIGSVSGDIEVFNKESLLNFLKEEFNVRFVLIKSSFTNILNFDDSLCLYNANWSKSKKKINSDYSIYVNLSNSLDDILGDCSSNFRRNIRRGEKKNHNIQIKKLCDFSVSKIMAVFDRFRDIKDVPLPNNDELLLIQRYLGNNIIVAASTIDDQVVGLRAFLYHDNKALDFWAATDLVGRKNYTSFVLLFRLLEEAKTLQVEQYDMSGIDPINNATGFSFKNGLRAKVVEKLGEWEFSNSKLLSCFVDKFYL